MCAYYWYTKQVITLSLSLWVYHFAHGRSALQGSERWISLVLWLSSNKDANSDNYTVWNVNVLNIIWLVVYLPSQLGWLFPICMEQNGPKHQPNNVWNVNVINIMREYEGIRHSTSNSNILGHVRTIRSPRNWEWMMMMMMMMMMMIMILLCIFCTLCGHENIQQGTWTI